MPNAGGGGGGGGGGTGPNSGGAGGGAGGGISVGSSKSILRFYLFVFYEYLSIIISHVWHHALTIN